MAIIGTYALPSGQAVWFYGNRTGCSDGGAPRAAAPPCGSVLLASGRHRTWRTALVTRASTIQGVAFATPAQGYVALSPDSCGFGADPYAHCGGEILGTSDGGGLWRPLLSARSASVADLAAPAPGVAWAWLVPSPPSCAPPARRCTFELVTKTGPGRPWRVAYRADAVIPVGSVFGSLWEGRRLFGWTYSTASGHILVTRDAGRSWQPLGRLPTGRATAVPVVSSIDFVNPDDGWLTFCNIAAVGNGGCENSLYATHDGGRTWTREVSTYCIDWMSVHMRSAEDGALLTGGQTACQSPSVTGPAYAITGSSYVSNAVYRTTDGGRHWRRAAAVPAILGSSRFSARGTWVAASSCAYAATGPQWGCRSFAGRLAPDGRLLPVYPEPVMPIGAARAGNGAVMALATVIPGGPLSVWTSIANGWWTREAIGNGPPPGVSLAGFGALPDTTRGWWLAATYPRSGHTWLWTAQSGGRVASWRIAPPSGNAAVPFVVTGPRSVWTWGCAPRRSPGPCDESLFHTRDAGRIWSRLRAPSGQIVLSMGLVGGRPVVLTQRSGCLFGARTGRCQPVVQRLFKGAWRVAVPLPAVVGARVDPELAPAASQITLGYTRGSTVHLLRLGAGGAWLPTLLATNDLAALPFGPDGPGLLLPNVRAVAGVSGGGAGTLAVP